MPVGLVRHWQHTSSLSDGGACQQGADLLLRCSDINNEAQNLLPGPLTDVRETEMENPSPAVLIFHSSFYIKRLALE